MQHFIREWQAGVRIVLSVVVIGGLILLSSALVGMLIFGFVVALPAELFFQAVIAESLYYWVALISGAVWGVAGLGRCKHLLVGAIDERP